MDFSKGVDTKYWGTVRYVCPLLSLKDICHLQTTDIHGEVVLESYEYKYEDDKVTTIYHPCYVLPPTYNHILIWHNGINHFNWV